MIATWLVGLLVALIATPVAVASYVSARQATAAERQPPRPALVPHDAPAPAHDRAPQRRHYHRRLAA